MITIAECKFKVSQQSCQCVVTLQILSASAKYIDRVPVQSIKNRVQVRVLLQNSWVEYQKKGQCRGSIWSATEECQYRVPSQRTVTE